MTFSLKFGLPLSADFTKKGGINFGREIQKIQRRYAGACANTEILKILAHEVHRAMILELFFCFFLWVRCRVVPPPTSPRTHCIECTAITSVAILISVTACLHRVAKQLFFSFRRQAHQKSRKRSFQKTVLRGKIMKFFGGAGKENSANAVVTVSLIRLIKRSKIFLLNFWLTHSMYMHMYLYLFVFFIVTIRSHPNQKGDFATM